MKMRFKCVLLFLFCTFSLFAVNQEDLPPPYDTAEILPFASHGFYSNAPQLQALIAKHQVKTIIEVGCWLGTSTRHMASCLPPGGIVYAVDHWKGSVEHQAGERAWIPEVPKLYEYFLSNIIHAGLTDKIIPIRMDSLEAAKQLNLVVDLVYIDASHDTESVYADLVAWYPHVRKNGIFCGDDWSFDTVRVAVHRFAAQHEMRIIASSNFWQLK